MPLLLKATYVHIFTSIVIFAAYGFWVFGIQGVEYFTGPDALAHIGQSIVALIVAGYAFEILLGLAIFGKGVFGALRENKSPLDEREEKILHTSLVNSHFVLCGGLFLSDGVMALGASAFWVFNAIVLAFLLSVIAELGTKLFFCHTAT